MFDILAVLCSMGDAGENPDCHIAGFQLVNDGA